MTRDKLFSSVALACAFAMPLVGCGGEDGEDATATEVAATPTATAEPTPVPLNNWQRFTMLQIADDGVGVDVNGDGIDDNGIYAAFDTIVDSLLTVVGSVIEGLTQGDTCQVEGGDCPLNDAQAKLLYETVESLIELTLSVETINDGLATTYEVGDNSPYALNLIEEGDGHGLYYFSGERYGDSYAVDEQIGHQSGLVADSGTSYFGPGDFLFSFEFGGAGDSAGQTVSFAINDAVSELEFDESSMDDAYTGGGVKLVELMALVEQVFELIGEVVEIPPEVEAEALAAIEAALVDVSDIECSDGTECFSISLAYDSEAVDTPK